MTRTLEFIADHLPKEPLKNVDEVVSSRQKSAKKRSLYVINEHFKPTFNAEMATQVVFQRFPKVTVEEVRRFSDTVEIRNAQAFAAELEAFVQERLESVELPPSMKIPLEIETVEQTLARKAAALRTDTRRVPGETDIQRGRAVLLEAFGESHNLPLPDFARLANKSRQQIYKDIKARRLRWPKSETGWCAQSV